MVFQLNAYARTIKVGSSNAASSAGLFLAKEFGYFQEEGIEVSIDIIRGSGAAMIPLLVSGELDVGGGNINAGLINAIIKSNSIRIVADKGHLEKETNYLALVVRSDLIKTGKYKNISDLKGMNFGVTSTEGVSQQILLDKALSTANLKLSDINQIRMSYPDINLALKNKKIEAAIQLEPYLSTLTKEKIATVVKDGHSIYPGQISAGLFFSEKFRNEKKLPSKFLRAYLKGVKLYNDYYVRKINTDSKVVKTLAKYLDYPNELIIKDMIPVGLNEDGTFDTKLLKNDIKWYHSNGFISKVIDIENVVDFSYLNSKD
jgi:NitT/TauT family transport system substrate-binding protein